MCGISGFCSLNKVSVKKEFLSDMIEVQNHRGPDSNNFYYNKHVGLAHNRLSLIDLSDNANQPFYQDNYVLIYNGEIYNFLELKKELPRTVYRSNSDTEVLFNCLKFWGIEKTLNKIQGMFAFAWYDISKDELVLVRDRIGIKPLFYGVDTNNCLWFASEVKAILKVSKFEPDPVEMLLSPIGGIVEKSKEKTLWNNLKTLTPGHLLVIKNGEILKKEYFNIKNYVNENEYNRLNKSTLSEVTDEFESIFDNSIQKLLISDAPMGAFVSGGIDSSLIASFAAKHQKDLKLFTANVVGKHSEISAAKLLANTLNKDVYQYRFEKEMAIRDITNVTWHYEAPLVVHFNALPFSNVAALARNENVKAVLTGEGADELFLGYPKLLTKKYERLIRFPYTILNKIYNSVPQLKSYLNKNEGSGGLSTLHELAVQGFDRQILRKENLSTYDFLGKKEQLQHYLSMQMINEGIISLLWRNDRMGMMHSIESRFPFLDEKVIQFSMNLPVKFKIGRTKSFYNYKHPFLIDKQIVRNLGKRSLPKKLFTKKKNGFPMHALRNMSVKPELFYNGVFADLMKLSRVQINHMTEKNSYTKYHIALIAMFEIWGRLFVDNRSKEEVNSLALRSLSIEE
ncbi:MAG: asparagine synthase (glutamine-hydrolyzing) [Flavobacteriaceae bacterium]|nr:asparagine synthase (glutamine-hydrolyzing) [Flavobacteriaceae bacterium]